MFELTFIASDHSEQNSNMPLSEYLDGLKTKRFLPFLDHYQVGVSFRYNNVDLTPGRNFGRLDFLAMQLPGLISAVEQGETGAFRDAAMDGNGYYFLFIPMQNERFRIVLIELGESRHPYYDYFPVKGITSGDNTVLMSYFEDNISELLENNIVPPFSELFIFTKDEIKMRLENELKTMKQLLTMIRF